MVKLRVNGTRARTETAVKLRGKISHPESLPVLNLGVGAEGWNQSGIHICCKSSDLFLPRKGKLYFEQH